MIELNNRTQQDFLSKKWVQKLLSAGIDMSDAKYNLFYNSIFQKDKNRIFVDLKTSENYVEIGKFQNCVPTYTVSELFNKIHQHLEMHSTGTTIGTVKIYKGSDVLCGFINLLNGKMDIVAQANEPFYIESLASVLLQCQQS